jgi:hypothetical protein
MNILKRVKKFFGYSAGKQHAKIDKLEKMIAKLVDKAERLNKRYEKETSEKKKKALLKEHQAVKKILGKSRRKLEELKAED